MTRRTRTRPSARTWVSFRSREERQRRNADSSRPRLSHRNGGERLGADGSPDRRDARRRSIAVSGRVDCWGAGGSGELGNGSFDDEAPLGEVRGLAGATAIALGRSDTCAIVSGGKVSCWGEGQSGTLGNGATDDIALPSQVKGLS